MFELDELMSIFLEERDMLTEVLGDSLISSHHMDFQQRSGNIYESSLDPRNVMRQMGTAMWVERNDAGGFARLTVGHPTNSSGLSFASAGHGLVSTQARVNTTNSVQMGRVNNVIMRQESVFPFAYISDLIIVTPTDNTRILAQLPNGAGSISNFRGSPMTGAGVTSFLGATGLAGHGMIRTLHNNSNPTGIDIAPSAAFLNVPIVDGSGLIFNRNIHVNNMIGVQFTSAFPRGGDSGSALFRGTELLGTLVGGGNVQVGNAIMQIIYFTSVLNY